jgi:hypothetical protein
MSYSHIVWLQTCPLNCEDTEHIGTSVLLKLHNVIMSGLSCFFNVDILFSKTVKSKTQLSIIYEIRQIIFFYTLDSHYWSSDWW